MKSYPSFEYNGVNALFQRKKIKALLFPDTVIGRKTQLPDDDQK